MAVGCPYIAFRSFSGQLVQEFSNFGVVFDKLTVVICQTQELLEFIGMG